MTRKLKCTNPATSTYGSSCIDYKCTLHETCPILKKFNLDIKNSKELIIDDITFTTSKDAEESEIQTNLESILDCIDDCEMITKEIKDLQGELDYKRNTLSTLFKNLKIKNIKMPSLTISGYETQRFKGWADEEALIKAIPKYYRNLQTLSPNHKKITVLIKKHKLAIELLNFEEKSEPKFTLRFTNKE